jgi:hypothetical protein
VGKGGFWVFKLWVMLVLNAVLFILPIQK